MSWAGSPVVPELPADLAALVLGLHETDPTCFDCRGNKDFQYNPLFWSGQILEPVVNQWLATEVRQRPREGKTFKPNPLWPQDKDFAVCLTHDVDVAGFIPMRWVRQIKRNVKARPRGKIWDRRLLTSLSGLGIDLLSLLLETDRDSLFDPWLELEQKYGFRSTFFFFPDKPSRYHERDGHVYRHHDPINFAGQELTVSEVMRELDHRGWEVGLHGTFYSFDDAQELKKQKEQVEHSLGREIVSIRQHCLHFDITKTPQAQSQAGFKYDTTFGSNRIIGFRNGLALPFQHYDLVKDKPLPILQIPLHIQDGALLRQNNLDLSPDIALKRSKELIDKVERVNGLVTLLWHPNLCQNRKFPGWFWVYEELLKYISRKNAWVAPVAQVGAWWQKHQTKMLTFI